MARNQNKEQYLKAKNHILQTGLDLYILNSFNGVGLNTILDHAKIPKGSFYHYFKNKEDFGLQVLDFYHNQQLNYSRDLLCSDKASPYDRLKGFFVATLKHYKNMGFTKGCLMSNLSLELADNNDNFRTQLRKHWDELSSVIEQCIAELDKEEVGLEHLTDAQAASFLINSWSGALTRMKVEKRAAPLQLFCKAVFKKD